MIRIEYVDTHVTAGPRPGTFCRHTIGLVEDAVTAEALYITSFPPTVEESLAWPGPEPTLEDPPGSS